MVRGKAERIASSVPAPTKPGKVTVPEHAGKDIHPDVVKSIMKQAGITDTDSDKKGEK